MARRRLAGQRALVTGASSGIGRALALRLAAEGADLVVTARREERLRELAAEVEGAHGVAVSVEAIDLGAPGAAADLYARTEGAGVAVDVLVNNAGFGDYEQFVASPWERLSAMMTLNMTALTELTHRFAPRMVERGRGRVLNVASIAAFLPNPNFAVYAATKAYVRNLSEALDAELRPAGVRCMVLCPGGTRTEFLETAGQRERAGAGAVMMSAERCADIGVRAMLAGRRTVVPGWLNATGMSLLRLVPRALMPWVAAVSVGSAVAQIERPALPGPPGDDQVPSRDGGGDERDPSAD